MHYRFPFWITESFKYVGWDLNCGSPAGSFQQNEDWTVIGEVQLVCLRIESENEEESYMNLHFLIISVFKCVAWNETTSIVGKILASIKNCWYIGEMELLGLDKSKFDFWKKSCLHFQSSTSPTWGTRYKISSSFLVVQVRNCRLRHWKGQLSRSVQVSVGLTFGGNVFFCIFWRYWFFRSHMKWW